MTVIHSDCLDAMRAMPDASVDSIVSDPPYGLAFMGKAWDHGVPGEPFWAEALRVAKPGAYLVAFGGTRTYHRLACAIEDAGWEIRDCLSYLYGSGFPKSHNLDKTGAFCGCESQAERDVRLVRDADVSPSIQHQEAGGEVLLAGVPEPGAPVGQVQRASDARPRESVVEGRCDVEAGEGQLLGSAVRACAGVGIADGTDGRVHRGASAGDGEAGWSPAGPSGSGASPESRPLGQQAGELGTVADERIAQASGVWPTCERCGKPCVPRGLGTALKPAWEPIILARKPLIGTVAANVTAHGTGALNVDGCRIEALAGIARGGANTGRRFADGGSGFSEHERTPEHPLGRWPANVCLDEDAAAMLDAQSGTLTSGANPTRRGAPKFRTAYGEFDGQEKCTPARGVDSGGASRFFYTAKASRREREAGLEGMERKSMRDGAANHTPRSLQVFEQHGKLGSPAANHHPTVKPIALMRWLVRLVTPPNGLVLDPFTGSGTTGCAAVLEGFRFLGCEREAEYVAIAEKRIAHWAAQKAPEPEPSLF